MSSSNIPSLLTLKIREQHSGKKLLYNHRTFHFLFLHLAKVAQRETTEHGPYKAIRSSYRENTGSVFGGVYRVIYLFKVGKNKIRETTV